MKSGLKLEAKTRTLGRQSLKKLRAAGFVPAVVYGPQTDNLPLQIKKSEALKIYEQGGESSLITLDIDGQDERQVIIKDISQSSVTNQLLHIDFFQVNMAEKLTTEVELNFVGEAPAVKQLGGVVVKNLSHLDVDISGLTELGSHITFADLKLPKGIVLSGKHEMNEILVAVEEPRAVVAESEVETTEEVSAEEVPSETAPEAEVSGEEQK